jgi:hypothetical protein
VESDNDCKKSSGKVRLAFLSKVVSMNKSPLDFDWRAPQNLLRFGAAATEMTSMVRKLIIPGQDEPPASREKFIEKFLKEWLTERQLKGMGPWYTDMLDAFMTEVLLKAQKVGIEKMLLHRGLVDCNERIVSRSKVYPLAIVPKELKPKIAQVTLEEVGGDLASQTKFILLSDVKLEKKENEPCGEG